MSESPLPAPPIVPASLWQRLSSRDYKHLTSVLRHKDFRIFLAGSFLSNIGTWMQSLAQAWLVLQLSNSPFYLGLDGFANTIPIAIFALLGGVAADRLDRRRLLLWTQGVMCALALMLAVLAQFEIITVWEVIFFSFCTGLAQSIAWPVYQAVLANIVPRENMSQAIALNSTQFNLARMIGPLFGAVALSSIGTAGCFYANAFSFVGVMYAMYRLRQPTNRRSPEEMQQGVLESMREGLGYMVANKALLWLLISMAVTTLLGVPLVTLLPVFARDVLTIGASGLGILVGAFGAGAVAGGILVAILGDFHGKGRFVVNGMAFFVVGMIGFAVSRNVLISVICLFFTGFSMVSFVSVINTVIQNSVPDHLRGRAMSLFVFAFGGVMPLANLLAGTLAKFYTAPHALLMQGLALGGYVVYLYYFHREIRSGA
jgi:MFS family permease